MQGFAAITVGNGAIETTIVPELGAKLAGLRDLRTGREWLWTSRRIPFARHDPGASSIEVADNGGCDECFPTVAPCGPVTGWPDGLPDHGQVWSLPWDVETSQFDNDAVEIEATVEIAGSYRRNRMIRVEPVSATVTMHDRLDDRSGIDRGPDTHRTGRSA